MNASLTYQLIDRAYHHTCRSITRRLLENANRSPMLTRTLTTLTHDDQGDFSPTKLRTVVSDAAAMTGVPPWRVAWDAVRYAGGRQFALYVVGQQLSRAMRGWWVWLTRLFSSKPSPPPPAAPVEAALA